MKRIRVAVKSDDIVLRDPKSMVRLTTKGKVVNVNAFWLRRLKAGDCIALPLLEENTNLKEGKKPDDNLV